MNLPDSIKTMLQITERIDSMTNNYTTLVNGLKPLISASDYITSVKDITAPAFKARTTCMKNIISSATQTVENFGIKNTLYEQSAYKITKNDFNSLLRANDSLIRSASSCITDVINVNNWHGIINNTNVFTSTLSNISDSVYLPDDIKSEISQYTSDTDQKKMSAADKYNLALALIALIIQILSFYLQCQNDVQSSAQTQQLIELQETENYELQQSNKLSEEQNQLLEQQNELLQIQNQLFQQVYDVLIETDDVSNGVTQD